MNPNIEHLVKRMRQRGWDYGQIVKWFGDQNYVPQADSIKTEVQMAFDNLVMEGMERVLEEHREQSFLTSPPPCHHRGSEGLEP